MLKHELEEVGHRQLREQLAPLLRQLGETGRPTAVTNRNKVEAILVPAPMFEDLERARIDLDQLRNVVPLLLAAATAGAAIPSETLDQLGLTEKFDWRLLNAFQSAFPVRITHDDMGRPIPRLPRGRPVPVSESEDDLAM
jgi:PHD/YefM family antitoxin component YafN of YafNO toxin-antitoxin module